MSETEVPNVGKHSFQWVRLWCSWYFFNLRWCFIFAFSIPRQKCAERRHSDQRDIIKKRMNLNVKSKYPCLCALKNNLWKGLFGFQPFPTVCSFDQQPTIVDDRMAKNLSLAELTALYANKGKNPKALFEADVKSDLGTVLPGSTTADKLSKLFFTRQ